MYKREKIDTENVIDVFDGYLTQYLKDIGVPEEHIEKMKHRILQPTKNTYYKGKPSEGGNYEKDRVLVPLDKVIGTSRGSVGKSVYENVREMHNGARVYGRFENCFSYLEKMSLEELKESYKNLPRPVKMEYYEDEDEYYLTTDGNHRTLTAMLLGAEYILADVEVLTCDYEKKEKYLAQKEFYQEYNIKEICYEKWDTVEILFKENGTEYLVTGYPWKIGGGCFANIESLKANIDADRKVVGKIEKLPDFLRDITVFLCSFANGRISQYIYKSLKTSCNNRVLFYIL